MVVWIRDVVLMKLEKILPPLKTAAGNVCVSGQRSGGSDCVKTCEEEQKRGSRSLLPRDNPHLKAARAHCPDCPLWGLRDKSNFFYLDKAVSLERKTQQFNKTAKKVLPPPHAFKIQVEANKKFGALLFYSKKQTSGSEILQTSKQAPI